MRYLFEDYTFDTECRELRRGAEPVSITPQVFDLLHYLIRNRGRVVSKDDVIAAVWSGRIVSDAALTTRLNAVRRAVGNSGEQQRLVRTFPRKGFRFVGAVHDVHPGPGAAVAPDDLAAMSEPARAALKAAASVPDSPETVSGRTRSRGWLGHLGGPLKLVGGALASFAAAGAIAGGLTGYWSVWNTVRTDVVREAQKIQGPTVRPEIAPRLTLVVMPFANLNNDPEQDYLADDITRDLTTGLARATATFVVGRETAFTYRNKTIDLTRLGTDLGIRWAVQGAVRRSGDQVRVSVSLIDLRTARDVWSDRFDGDRANTDRPAGQHHSAASLHCTSPPPSI